MFFHWRRRVAMRKLKEKLRKEVRQEEQTRQLSGPP
jgi:hypothetical protein